MGPAGLFAALCLAEAGLPCIILERGQPVERRVYDVERFRQKGLLDPSSNVQFGEGGAGTFSDGKLTTGTNDVRNAFVLERLVEFGAPEEILYLSKPHIGTDRLRLVVRAIRERLLALGCDIRFGHRLADIVIDGGALRAIDVERIGGARMAGAASTATNASSHGDGVSSFYSMPVTSLFIAPGNSARDTFEMLMQRGVRMSSKPLSVGVRIEHLQHDIDAAQYGRAAVQHSATPPASENPPTAPRSTRLPASDYKLVAHLDSGRSVYTFCVCPGGQVVASSSEPGGVATNGMSAFARNGENCNGALLVSVSPSDFNFGLPDGVRHGALGGVEFQRRLEHSAFIAGGGDYFAPAQLLGDFMEKRISPGSAQIYPTYLPGIRFVNLWDILPGFISESLYEALPVFGKRIKGFADPGAVLTAVETRSSSPVRIERDEFQAVGVKGIYPCGEGAGYSGGIMSSAVDGIKCAEAILRDLNARR